jgi:hypothetical protein
MRICLLLLALLPAAALKAQMVGGHVVDQQGAPVRGAVVTLVDSGLVAVDSAACDSSGAFYLTAMRGGGYLMRVSAPGLAPVGGRAFRLEGSEFHQERITLNVVAGAAAARVFTELKVQEPATPMAGNRAPVYPVALRAQRVGGETPCAVRGRFNGRACSRNGQGAPIHAGRV